MLARILRRIFGSSQTGGFSFGLILLAYQVCRSKLVFSRLLIIMCGIEVNYYVCVFVFLASSPSRGEQNSSRYRNSDRPPSLRLSWMGEAWPSWLDCGLGRNHQAHRRLSRRGLSCQTVTRILEVSKQNDVLK